jgi:tetratricopeptide (TPR) repeat protein
MNSVPNKSAYLQNGDLCMSKNDWAEASKFYKMFTDIEPFNTNVLSKLGFCYSRSGQHDLAIKMFNKLAELEPKIAKWQYMIGYQHYDKKDWKHATLYFEKALHLKQNYIKVLYRNGYARIQTGDYDQAEEQFQKCIKCWSQLSENEKQKEKKYYSDACFQIGKIFLKKGLSIKAERNLVEAVKYDDADEFKHYNLGKSYLKNNKLPQAIEQFSIANSLKSHVDYFLDKLGIAYLKAGKLSEAEQVYRSIPTLKRKYYIWCNMGMALLKNGKIQEAITSLQTATRMAKNNHRIHFYLGSAYFENGDYKKASMELDLAIKLKKEFFSSDYKEAFEKLKLIPEQTDEHSGADMEAEKQQGYIMKYFEKKGFGFLKSDDGEQIFFHINEVINPSEISQSRKAEFVLLNHHKGPRAKKVFIFAEANI